MSKVLFGLIIVSLFASCKNSPSDSSNQAEQIQISEKIFNDAVTKFTVKVIYEDGAEPYTGTIGLSGNDTWDITKTSYQELFSNHLGRTISVPASLANMNKIGNQSKSSWTSDELISLGNTHSSNLKSGTEITVNIFIVKGKYNGSSSILGVHFSGHHFAFVFKDIVKSVGGDSATQRYVEQATIVHEIGHLVGLVNNGVPMAANHEDSEHSKHTSNSEGVMYWAVESSDNIITSITDIITGNRIQLFGNESLADAKAYHP